ncbi:MAG: hypothetical protein KDE20_10875, partial [Caldilineaceae bacterium]|nr:hypothetical protein [Caldilineaceae bacterium]
SDIRPYIVKSRESAAALRAALAAQPAEPVAWAGCGDCDCSFSCHNGEARCIRLKLAPAAVPPIDDMDAVAIRYAHKMALDLECILAEYGGSWYNTAMQTLGEYRSAMNAIHERECPTFMGEPVIAAGDKT